MANYRVVFTKTGRLKYISHLDLQRAFARMLLRSGLPLQWSEGFNPHPKLNIALPLPIYQEGKREILDFKAEDGLDTAFIKEKLQSVSFEGMDILSVSVAENKLAPKKAVYSVTFNGSVDSESLKSALQTGMKITKKTKSGTKEIDIAPLIDLIESDYNEGTLRFKVSLPASPNDYLNPAYIAAFFGEKISRSYIVREEIII